MKVSRSPSNSTIDATSLPDLLSSALPATDLLGVSPVPADESPRGDSQTSPTSPEFADVLTAWEMATFVTARIELADPAAANREPVVTADAQTAGRLPAEPTVVAEPIQLEIPRQVSQPMIGGRVGAATSSPSGSAEPVFATAAVNPFDLHAGRSDFDAASQLANRATSSLREHIIAESESIDRETGAASSANVSPSTTIDEASTTTKPSLDFVPPRLEMQLFARRQASIRVGAPYIDSTGSPTRQPFGDGAPFDQPAEVADHLPRSEMDASQTSPRAPGERFMWDPQAKRSPASRTTREISVLSLELPPSNGRPWESADSTPVPRIVTAIHDRVDSLATGQPIDVRLRLDPPELGTVHVHLRLIDDVVSVRLVGDNESATRLLESQLPDLRQSLAERGLTFGHCEVSCDAGRQDHSAFHQDIDFSTIAARSPRTLPRGTPSEPPSEPIARTRQLSVWA